MRTRILSIAALALSLLLLQSAGAWASSPHYINGLMGIKAATMPPPGTYYNLYNIYYNAGSVKNDGGHEVGLDDFHLNAYMMIHSFTYSSERRILGGRWVFDIDIPLVNVDYSLTNTFGKNIPDFMGFHDFTLSKSGSSLGLSDIVFNPVMLVWDGDRYSVVASLSFFLPTGRYDSGDPSSPGKGFWTFMPGLGATVYLDKEKTWSASIMARYEIHSEQKETDTTPGDHFHFEWGIGKEFKNWEAGIAGYCSWQVTDDKGPKARKNRTDAFAAGPEVKFSIPSWKAFASFRSLWEFGNRSNAEGNMTTLALTWRL